jgi:hypothetical protein
MTFSQLKKICWQKRSWLIALLAATIFVIFAGTRPGSDHHQLFNLEPYPDGLFFVVPAWRFAHGQGMTVGLGERVILHPQVLPVYQYFLGVGFLLLRFESAWFWLNLLLGVSGVALLAVTLQRLFDKTWVTLVGIGLFLLHGYVLWLPSLPMAENLVLFLFLASIWGITQKKLSWRSVTISVVTIGFLGMTKYTALGPAVVLAVFLLGRLLLEKSNRRFLCSVGIWLPMGIWFIFYHMSQGINPLPTLQTQLAKNAPVQSLQFYSWKYLSSNASFYTQAVLGKGQNFLWLRYPLTSVTMIVIAVFSATLVFLQHLKKKAPDTSTQAQLALVLTTCFAAQLPLLLIFYSRDLRYFILAIPILVLLVCLGLSRLGDLTRLRKWVIPVVVVLIATQLFSEKSFLRYVVVTNLLQRSNAWQYQAVKLAAAKIPDKDATLVTALPPFLFEFYSPGKFQLLPLSQHQEFADKGQNVWSDDVPLTNLEYSLEQRLGRGEKVYISNAYLSSNHQLFDDFAALEKRFRVTKIFDGCDQTCNIYKLENFSH